MKEYALKYYKKGLNVVPVRGKIPCVKWRKFTHSRIPERLIHEWWDLFPDAGVATITGRISGIVVLDVDNDEKGKEILSKVNTLTAKTSRGYHFYFRYLDIASSRVEEFDLKSDCSLVVMPPSQHPSGVRYEWVRITKVCDMPEWIVKLFRSSVKRPHFDVSILKGVNEGLRNETLTRLAGSWFKAGLSFQEALDVALLWNSHNVPPLEESEVESTVKSIWKRESQFKKQLPRYIAQIKVQVPEDIPEDALKRITIFDVIKQNDKS